MTSPSLVYLVRHARPLFPGGEPICMGSAIDLPLSPEGRAQAAKLGEAFARLPIDAVYTSPMRRARQSAQPIAGARCPLIECPALTELDGGEWDGLALREIHARYPMYFDGRASVPPGGETDAACLARVLPLLDSIDLAPGRAAVLVAHGGLNRVLLCHLRGMPMQSKRTIPQDYACVNRLVRTDGRWRAEQINSSADELTALEGLCSR